MAKKYFKYLMFLLLIFNNYSILYPNGSSGSNPKYENRRIVDMPNCGMLQNNNIAFDISFLEHGVLYLGADYSILKMFNVGVSYSTNLLLGEYRNYYQKYPGLNLKARILDESLNFPAIAVGFSNQGFSTYISNLERFQVHSPGLFIVLSKSFKWNLGYLASHLGVNYSFDNEPENRTLNYYFGIEQSISSTISLNIEYNFQRDEKSVFMYAQKGLLNLALRASIIEGLTLDFQIKDVLYHYRGEGKNPTRQIGFEIIKKMNF